MTTAPNPARYYDRLTDATAQAVLDREAPTLSIPPGIAPAVALMVYIGALAGYDQERARELLSAWIALSEEEAA